MLRQQQYKNHFIQILMTLNNEEILYLKELKTKRQIPYIKVVDRNTQNRIIAENLKMKGLIKIEDITGSDTLEFAQLTVKGKIKIEELEDKKR